MADDELSLDLGVVTPEESLNPKHYLGLPCKRGHSGVRFKTSRACILCARNDLKAWRLEHPEQAKATLDAWLVTARPKRNAWQREWSKANPEKCKRVLRNWRDANPGAERASWAKRRALKLGASGTHTTKELAELLILQKSKCAHDWCRVSIKKVRHADHIMPLCLGGSNDIKNIQLLCPLCNQRKHTKHPIDFAQLNGRLL